MSLAGAAGTHGDEHFPAPALGGSLLPKEPGGSPSLADLPRDGNASNKSVEYSRSQCSCSLISYYDYSEDFLSDCSETPTNENSHYLEKPVIEEKKEKKDHVSELFQPKGKQNVPAETRGLLTVTPLLNALTSEMAAFTFITFPYCQHVLQAKFYGREFGSREIKNNYEGLCFAGYLSHEQDGLRLVQNLKLGI